MRCLLLFLLSLVATPAFAQTDTILQLDGTERLGRVVLITPTTVHYLPPAGADTLRVASSQVFLVRFANGTREVLNALQAGTGANELFKQDVQQRQHQARVDAGRHYDATGPTLGSFAAGLVGGPLFGLAAPIAISTKRVSPKNLGALTAEQLTDPAYMDAYACKALRKKKVMSWFGYAAGSVVWMAAMGFITVDGPNMGN